MNISTGCAVVHLVENGFNRFTRLKIFRCKDRVVGNFVSLPPFLVNHDVIHVELSLFP